jgi:hypothetical protein
MLATSSSRHISCSSRLEIFDTTSTALTNFNLYHFFMLDSVCMQHTFNDLGVGTLKD